MYTCGARPQRRRHTHDGNDHRYIACFCLPHNYGAVWGRNVITFVSKMCPTNTDNVMFDFRQLRSPENKKTPTDVFVFANNAFAHLESTHTDTKTTTFVCGILGMPVGHILRLISHGSCIAITHTHRERVTIIYQISCDR